VSGLMVAGCRPAQVYTNSRNRFGVACGLGNVEIGHGSQRDLPAALVGDSPGFYVTSELSEAAYYVALRSWLVTQRGQGTG